MANALSRQFEDREAAVTTNSACVLAMSAMVPTWVQEVSKSYEEDPEVCALISEFSVNHLGPHIYHYSSGVLR